jgi:hypothetical protein
LLLRALERHCACPRRDDGARLGTCSAHALLLDPQAPQRLLYARRIAPRLCAEEFQV